MKQSHLFFKTRKETPTDADSINASYLIRAGFVEKQMAGVYALLPLGFSVYQKIEKIIREEMNAIGGQEILMNVLQPKKLWDETGRFEEMSDIFYKLKDDRGTEIGLAPTHEEQITAIIRNKIKSYKNLPFSLYQIQVKFRNEPRAKSGLLRGREFIMKDLYSFHLDESDFNQFYEIAKKAYLKIFNRMGLKAIIVEASGGVFSKYSHEFQVLSETGEDTIFYCEKCQFAQNKEISTVKEKDDCPKCGAEIKSGKSIEVGNIFPLKNKFSSVMGAAYLDAKGQEKDIFMGCYGIGLTRSLAAVVEVNYDQAKNKMSWPKELAPYSLHLISLKKNIESEALYKNLLAENISVLYDDRDISAGEKFAEADLIGIPDRIIISDKSIAAGGVEIIDSFGKAKIVEISRAVSVVNEKQN